MLTLIAAPASLLSFDAPPKFNSAFQELLKQLDLPAGKLAADILSQLQIASASTDQDEYEFQVELPSSESVPVLRGRARKQAGAEQAWLCLIRTEQGENSLHASRLAALGEMASGIAHEINNPLTVILARASLIEMKITDAAVLDSIKKIQHHAQRISKITRGLRVFSREESSDPMSEFPLNEIMEDSLAISSERSKSNGVRIYSAIEDNLIGFGRGYQVSQILINLLNNANDAVAGTAFGEIHLSAHREENKIKVRVWDNGPGVPSAIERKIMSPFFTTKGVGKGTGLGLSISLGIAKAHGGDLRLNRSISDSCFELTLPFADASKFLNLAQYQEKKAV